MSSVSTRSRSIKSLISGQPAIRRRQQEKKNKPLSEQVFFNLTAQERRGVLKWRENGSYCIDVPYKGGTLSRRTSRAGSSAAFAKSSNSLEHESHTLNWVRPNLYLAFLFYPPPPSPTPSPIKAHKCPERFISIQPLYFIPLPPTLFLSLALASPSYPDRLSARVLLPSAGV